jgi:hypothetical protein
MDGQQTRTLVYAGSYTACCEGGEAPGGGSPQHAIILFNARSLYNLTAQVLISLVGTMYIC